MQQLWPVFLAILCILAPPALLRAQAPAKDLPITELQKLAEQGSPSAQNELGVRYRVGDGVAKDLKKSVDLYRLAAKQGYAVAYFNLGAAYYNGDGVPSDPEVGCKWFLLAANAGDSSGKEAYERTRHEIVSRRTGICEVLAGDAYMTGKETPMDPVRGRDLYEQGERLGSPEADLRLYLVYMQGVGVQQDPTVALQWAQKAADRRSPQGLLFLGRMYENGVGTAADPKKACECYKTAAFMNPDAIAGLARLTRNGLGVKRDNERAFVLAYRAADHGSVEGKALFDEMTSTMSAKDIERLKRRAEGSPWHLNLPSCH